MSKRRPTSSLSMQDMACILSVTRALAAPFELHAMLQAVTEAARNVLRAERASVWLHDAATGELVSEVAVDLPPIRLPVDAGLVGASAREQALINVPDCYADPRFNPDIDRRTGFRTHCALAVPLVDHEQHLVGVLQVLNNTKRGFDAADEALAEALAAQCAIALSRVRMSEAVLAGRLMRHELMLASHMQRSTLPQAWPEVSGYAMHAVFQPASLTGGDSYDLARVDQGLLVVLADATGHGIGPALSVTRMQAMLRMALRLGAPLETAFTQVNDQLSSTLHDGHFVNAFIGLLDAERHRLRFLSGGQGPILHLHAADGRCTVHRPTSFPMGASSIQALRPAVELVFQPGDWLVLLSDGIYEYENAAGERFGRARVEQVVQAVQRAPHLAPAALATLLMQAVNEHAAGAPQQDDITLVLVKRDVLPWAQPAMSKHRHKAATDSNVGFGA